MTDDEIGEMSSEEVLARASTVAERLRQQIEAVKQAQVTQPDRLSNVRASAAAERSKTLAAEPWTDAMTGIPAYNGAGELSGMMPMPTLDGKELWGARLAFDLLGCCTDKTAVDDCLSEYLALIKEPDHLFLVAAAALSTIATYVVPQMLDDLETHGSNYDARVLLAEAAHNAWTTKLTEARQRFTTE